MSAADPSLAALLAEIEQFERLCATETWPLDSELVSEARGLLAAAARALREQQSMADAAEMLWVVLANVSGGDWTKQSLEWQEAAVRWRDTYFAALASSPAERQERKATQ